jgi:hypothetical protein
VRDHLQRDVSRRALAHALGRSRRTPRRPRPVDNDRRGRPMCPVLDLACNVPGGRLCPEGRRLSVMP